MQPPTSVNRPPLRAGLILGPRGIARFALDIVRHLRTARYARIDLVIRETRVLPPPTWLLRLFDACDRRVIQVASDPAQMVPAGSELSDVPQVTLDELSADTISRVDLLLDLRLDGGRIDGRPLPPLGWWWLFHGPRPPAGYWEVVTGNPLTTMELRVTRETTPGDCVLGYAATATVPGLSLARNRHALFRAAVTLVTQKLREVYQCGWEPAATRSLPQNSSAQTMTESRGPSSFELASWLIPTLQATVLRRLRGRPGTLAWRMAIRAADRPLVEGGSSRPAGDFRWLPAPVGRQYADPFLIQREDALWCFFEDIDAATGRGRIAAAEINPGVGFGMAVPVLERPYHLSYPCVFQDGDALFMIPETSESGAIELYRCTRFPDAWTLERVLIQQVAVDTTICRHEGRYWLFTTRVHRPSYATELWLYSSESLAGAWTPHPQNPISLDVRNTRGAGAIVNHNGRLFRPSQDCSIRYGRRFSLNEIVVLTTERFEERPVVTVEPMPGFVGTHSYALSGSIEMIDGCVLVRPSDAAQDPS